MMQVSRRAPPPPTALGGRGPVPFLLLPPQMMYVPHCGAGGRFFCLTLLLPADRTSWAGDGVDSKTRKTVSARLSIKIKIVSPDSRQIMIINWLQP